MLPNNRKTQFFEHDDRKPDEFLWFVVAKYLSSTVLYNAATAHFPFVVVWFHDVSERTAHNP